MLSDFAHSSVNVREQQHRRKKRKINQTYMNILNSDLSGICLLRTYDRKNLIIEQAAVIHGGKVFLQATYKLEIDTCLIFTAYSMSQELATAASQQHCQNMRDEAEKLGKILQKLLLSRSMDKMTTNGYHFLPAKVHRSVWQCCPRFQSYEIDLPKCNPKFEARSCCHRGASSFPVPTWTRWSVLLKNDCQLMLQQRMVQK